MSTSSIEFVNLLQLSGQRFSQVSLDGILINIFDFASAIWQAPRMYDFVEHGVDHSFRLAQIALNILDIILPEDVRLSPIERLVLGIGSLVHDIGMQYSKYPQAGKEKTPNEIRISHCDLGNEMIKTALEGTFNRRAGPSLSLEEHHKMFVNYGALVGFSHSDTKYWQKLRESAYAQRKLGGLQIFRPRLLAAVHRLADELHAEFTRIPELNWISTPLLTTEQKAHWTACYYTHELKLSSPGPGSLRIRMRWHVPENSSDNDVLLIRTLLQELRQQKAAAEFGLIKEFLKWKDEMEDCLLEYILDPEPERLNIQTLPEEVANLIISRFLAYQLGQKKVPSLPKTREIPSTPESDKAKNKAQTFFLSGEGCIRGHYRLRTGWHTNCYVRCRNLTADLEFSVGLCQALANLYTKEVFTDIISIGTSALRIGSLLSFLLSVKHQSTFADAQIRGEVASRKDYTEYEKVVLISPNARVLIIDDILGMGSVVEKVIKQFAGLNKPPERIKAFCLYALGDLRETSKRLSGLEIDYLAAFPDVIYAKEDSHSKTCEICSQRPHIIQDE